MCSSHCSVCSLFKCAFSMCLNVLVAVMSRMCFGSVFHMLMYCVDRCAVLRMEMWPAIALRRGYGLSFASGV